MSGSPLPRMQLDDFGGLDDADEAGQDAEHAAFRAGGNEAGRRRFRIEAAVAGALLGGEDAGLAFETEDGAVGVGLAGEHAGVVDQVARGKIVGAVGDDGRVFFEIPRLLDENQNKLLKKPPYAASARALNLHKELTIADLHADPPSGAGSVGARN